MLLWLGCLVLSIGSVSSEGLPPFAILKPNTFRFGLQGQISVLLFESVKGNVSLHYYNETIVWYPKKVESQQTLHKERRDIVRQDKMLNFTFQLPDERVGVHKFKVSLEIENYGSFEYDVTSGSMLKNNGYRTFVQTDKPVYKPGELIRYRAFTVDLNLRPIAELEGLEVTISLPNGVEMLKEICNSTNNVLHQGQFQLAEEASLGDYKISVDGKGDYSSDALCGFTVEEYVLPKFGIEISGPSHINADDATISGTVTSTYTYGKPVNGQLRLSFAVDNKKQSSYSGAYTFHTLVMEITEGKADFEISTEAITKRLRYLFNPFCEPTSLIITANVTDDARSFSVGKVDDSAKFVQSSYDLSFNPNTQQTYVAGMNYYVELDVKSLTANATKENLQKMKVKITAVYNVKNPTYIYKSVKIHNEKAYAVFEIPEETCSVKITAEIDLATSCESIFTCYQPERVVSQDKEFIRFDKQAPRSYKVGETAQFKVVTKSVDVEKLHYIVVRKGEAVKTGTLEKKWQRYNANSNDLKQLTFSLKITENLNIRSRIMVFAVSAKTGYMLADAADICIKEELENSVKLRFSKDMGEPGQNVTLYFDTAPNSFVGLSVVDASLNLLKKPCKSVSEEEALAFGRGLDTGDKKDLSCKRDDPYQCTTTTKVKITDAASVIRAQGFNLQSNIKIFEYKAPVEKSYISPSYSNYGGEPVIYAMEMSDSDQPIEYKAQPQEELSLEEDQQDPSAPRMRNVFPESWLWTDIVSNSRGQYEMVARVPDTITGWVGSAFGLSAEKGLGFSNEVNFKTFLPFFVSIDLPYSGTVGERVSIKIRVFNYLNKDTTATVKITSNRWDTTEKTVYVKNNTAETIDYVISLTEAGRHNITVVANATTDGYDTADASDAISKTLLVKPGGEKITDTQNVLIMERKTTEDRTTLKVELPRAYISGSHSLKFVAIGDFLGEAVTGISNLIELPSGCGEQNMHKIAINVYSARYIKRIYGEIQPHLQFNLNHNLNIGLQQQMAYRHRNGGYTVFKGGDASTWLTAFAYRTFSQYPKTEYFPCEVMKQDREYLMYKLDYNYGSSVSNAKREGWAPPQYAANYQNSQMYLNAYLIISVLEGEYENRCEQMNLFKYSYYQERVEKLCNQTVLQFSVSEADCCYDHMVRYAIGLCVERLDNFYGGYYVPDTCIQTTGSRQYQYAKCDTTTSAKEASSRQIEATAYAALALVVRKEARSALPLVMWLASQRNENGGYRSSQDTVVGVQALAEYANFLGGTIKGKTDLEISVGKKADYKMYIDDSNKLSTQEVIVSPEVGTYKVNWNGKGTAFVQLISTYHALNKKYKPIYKLSANVKSVDDEGVGYLVVRFKLPNTVSMMYMLDIASVTGTVFNKALIEAEMQDTETNFNEVTRYDVKNGGQRLLMYIVTQDRFANTTYYDLRIPFSRTFLVSSRAPAQVSMIDYYDPSKRETVFYKVDSDLKEVKEENNGDDRTGAYECPTQVTCDVIKQSDAIVAGYPGTSSSSKGSRRFQVTSATSYKQCGADFIFNNEAIISPSRYVDTICLDGPDGGQVLYFMTYNNRGDLEVNYVTPFVEGFKVIGRCYNESYNCASFKKGQA